MTDTNNKDEDIKNCCCFSILNKLDSLWDEYKHHSGKVSICLSVLGGASAILVGHHILIGSVAIAITNGAIFMSSIAYEKLKSEYKQLNSDCESHKEMIRRITTFQHNDTIKSTASTGKSNDSIEPVNFEKIHKNDMIVSYAFPDYQN